MSPTARRTVRAVGSVLAVLMVLAAALSATAQLSRHSATTTHELSPGLTSVELVNDVGTVHVSTVGAGERPRAVANATGGFLEPRVDVGEAGGAASLDGHCPNNLWFGPCDVEWQLYLPADIAVSVTTSVGDITVDGVGTTVRAEASVGTVRLLDVTAETVEALSSVGEVVVELDVPPSSLTATTSTGDVHVTVPDGDTTYRVRSTTSLGSVTTTVPVDDASPHRLELLTSIGDVTVRPG